MKVIPSQQVGYTTQRIKGKLKDINGESRKGVKLDDVGVLISLVRSFKASAKGTRIPLKDGLLGPLRFWMYPSNFRSISV